MINGNLLGNKYQDFKQEVNCAYLEKNIGYFSLKKFNPLKSQS